MPPRCRANNSTSAPSEPTPPPAPPNDAEPPSALFCLAAAALPALPFCIFLPGSTLLYWFPAWIAVFYLPVPKTATGYCLMALCSYVTYNGLIARGWSSWASIILGTVATAMCMNLALSALWDAAEPFLIGSPNFGQGTQVRHPIIDVRERPCHTRLANRVTHRWFTSTRRGAYRTRTVDQSTHKRCSNLVKRSSSTASHSPCPASG